MKRFFLISIFFLFNLCACSSQTADRNIVVINVVSPDRLELARVLSTINNSYNPKLVAIDIVFNGFEKGDDNELVEALMSTNSLVMASQLNDVGGLIFNVIGEPVFYPAHAKTGFINPILEDDLLNTLRKFQIMPESKFDKIDAYHLAVQAAMCFDSLKTVKFIKGHSNIVDIDYQNGKRCFKKFSVDEILHRKISRKDIEGKIILIGEVSLENKFVIPVYNKKSDTKRQMDGVEVIANIIAQILEY